MRKKKQLIYLFIFYIFPIKVVLKLLKNGSLTKLFLYHHHHHHFNLQSVSSCLSSSISRVESHHHILSSAAHVTCCPYQHSITFFISSTNVTCCPYQHSITATTRVLQKCQKYQNHSLLYQSVYPNLSLQHIPPTIANPQQSHHLYPYPWQSHYHQGILLIACIGSFIIGPTQYNFRFQIIILNEAFFNLIGNFFE